MKFLQGSQFLSPDGLLPVSVGVPAALSSSLPWPSPSEFRCCEPVGEGERGRPFPLPFLFGSCLNAHASPNEHAVSSLGVVFGIVFASFRSPFPLIGAPTAGLSSCQCLPCFVARDVFGPPTSNCFNNTSCRRMSSLERNLATKYFDSSDFANCILYRSSNMLSAGLSVTADSTSSHVVSKA